MLIPTDVEQLLRRHLTGLHVQSSLTYLANVDRPRRSAGRGVRLRFPIRPSLPSSLQTGSDPGSLQVGGRPLGG